MMQFTTSPDILKDIEVSILLNLHVPFNINTNFPFFHVPKSLHQGSPLEAEGSNEHVDTNTAESIFLQKGHQETKSNKYHHMDILKDWRENMSA